MPLRISGRHVLRGTDSPHLSWKCAQVTGKAGENGHHSGEMGGSSPRSSTSSKTARGSLSIGPPAGRTPPLTKRRDT